MKRPLLIGDVGGTNVRLALAGFDEPGFYQPREYDCKDFDSIVDVIGAYLDEAGSVSPVAVCLAIAAPIYQQTASFTNNSWTVSTEMLERALEVDRAWLVNDFEAIACSLPLLSADDLLPVGDPAPRSLDAEHCMVGVLGPGTGLGAAGLRKYGEHFIAITGEASHCGFAPESEEQLALLAALRDRFERVSDERLLSGPGLENIYWGLARVHGENCANLTAAQIMQSGIDESDPLASRAVALFFRILGQVAGNLALQLGAYDGIFIGGGIVRRYPERLVDSEFRRGFEDKGRHQKLMQSIPTQLIMDRHAGLLGAACVARRLAWAC